MPCTVTGTLRDLTGEPVPGARVIITAPTDIAAADGGALLPQEVTVHADGAGLLVVELLPGRYRIRWRDSNNNLHTSPFSVPDEPSAALEDLLVAAPVPVRGPAGRGWSSGYFDYATGKVVFESADGLGFETADLRGAGAALPPGSSGQVLGYGAGGVPQAVDPSVPLKSAQW